MDIQMLKVDLVKVSRLCYERRLVTAAGGNISCRWGKEDVLITAGGISLRDINPEHLITINSQGKKVDGCNDYKPSKEVPMHLAIYRTRPNVQAVLHLHPPYATSFSVKGQTVPMVTISSQLKLGVVPLVPVAPPGSLELSRHIEETLKQSGTEINTLLLERHGVLSFGTDLSEVFDNIELLEDTAKIAVISNNI